MNTFKTQFLALEASVKELREKVQKLEGTTPSTPDCHYVSFEREAGELPLDCMDTFRFVYSVPPNQWPTYTPSSGLMNPTCYTYTLINPSEDLKNYHITQAKLHNQQYYEYSTQQPHHGLRIQTETPPEKVEQSDIQFGIYNQQNSNYPIVLQKTKEMKEALAEKFFAFSKGTVAEFFNTETIQFKQEYEILPHVSFFITPLEKTNLTCKITEITKKSVTFQVGYVNPILDSSPDAILHWQIHGVKKPSHPIDLLE